MASVEYDPTFMRPIPGQDHYLVDGILTTQAITSILFYNNTIDIDPIEANYSITFKYDKSAVTSLLNTYVNMPDYALDLDLIEIETYHVYYRGFLLKE